MNSVVIINLLKYVYISMCFSKGSESSTATLSIHLSVLTFLSEGLVSSGLDPAEQLSSLHTGDRHTHIHTILKKLHIGHFREKCHLYVT